jgi:hypothetical protein
MSLSAAFLRSTFNSRCTIEWLRLAERLGVPLAQSADDGERGQLRRRSKPALDRGDVRVEH